MSDSAMTIFDEQADRIRLLMWLASREPERFGLTVCAACHKPIKKLRGIGVFLPSDEVIGSISPSGKYRIALFTLCLDCQSDGGDGLADEIVSVLLANYAR